MEIVVIFAAIVGVWWWFLSRDHGRKIQADPVNPSSCASDFHAPTGGGGGAYQPHRAGHAAKRRPARHQRAGGQQQRASSDPHRQRGALMRSGSGPRVKSFVDESCHGVGLLFVGEVPQTIELEVLRIERG